MNRIKKYIFALLLSVSMLFLCSFSTPVSAATNEPSTVAAATTEDNWKYILNNVDIDLKYLDKPDYVGLLYDSFAGGKSTDGYLYLCWSSPYYTKTNNTILQVTESGKTYNLYSSIDNMNNKKGNWLSTVSKDYPQYDLSLHMTPIGGYKDGELFGIPLKRTYNFTNFKFGYEGTNQAIGQCNKTMKFDLGITPQLDGKNSLQLCSLKYTIIENVEVMSHLDVLGHAGYKHEAYFNTSIKIDKIYRVDVAYKVTNDNKKWFEFYLKEDEHQIKKSLTTERVSGGIFGLYKFQGFEEGAFASTKDSSITYKYKLHLNYDDNSWNWFEGKEYHEADYKRVSNFQILRLNFVVDDDTYDVPVLCDTIEGETLNILDDDLILDTSTNYYQFKNAVDDFISKLKSTVNNIKNNWDKYKVAFIIAGCGVLGIIILIPVIKFLTGAKMLLGENNTEKKKE